MASRYAFFLGREVLKSSYPIDQESVRKLINDYGTYQKQSQDIFSVMESEAQVVLLQAFQLHEIDSAIMTLMELINQPVARNKVVAEAKMDL